MTTIKKIGHFFGTFAYAVGTIGGLGSTLYHKDYVIAICIAVLAGMAFPTAKEGFKDLLN
jgi:hypothetical protein